MPENSIPENVKAKRGIVYIATGSEFAHEAALSAETARNAMPDVNICIITDTPVSNPVFDAVIRVSDPEYGFIDKIQYMRYSPYNRTLFLDTDIYIYEDIKELFTLLDQFDIAAAYNHNRQAWELENVPESFPEYNTGVMMYRNDDRLRHFTERWAEHYWQMTDSPKTNDQPSFRRTLYESNLRVATLPNEYNCMVRLPGHAVGTVKLFHGRLLEVDSPGAGQYVDIEEAVEKLNEFPEHRVFTTLGGIQVYSDRQDTRLRRFRYILQRKGWLEALRRTGLWVIKKLAGQETAY